MTIQQLRYIVAVDQMRSFAKAADKCDVSQPTLSAMLQKMEEELDVRLFERNNKGVHPTAIGEKIIKQANNILREIDRVHELVAEEKGVIGGSFVLSVGPSIAPYVLPKFIKQYQHDYPDVVLSIKELKADNMIEALLRDEIDAGIAIADSGREGILEIPLYHERFYVYLSEMYWSKQTRFTPESLESESIWIMKDAQCLRDSAFSFCKAHSKGHHIYEAGSIDTLIRIVDENGGYTIIPEMHLQLLSDQQRKNVRAIESDHPSMRRVSMYIKEDYIRQRMLNTVAATFEQFLPKGLINEGILKYGIRL